MSRTHAHNRTLTRTASADELISRALRADADATSARLDAFRLDRAASLATDPGERTELTERAHRATCRWAELAHIVRTCSKRAAPLLASEGRDPRELIDVVLHARTTRAESLNPAGPTL